MAGRGGGGFSYEEGLFWVADRDRNQRLDKEEAKSVHNLGDDEIFARFDENSNNLINRLEFREFLQLSPWVEEFDRSKDK
ncbi:MAG: hypothetical protein ACRBDX_01400 [Gammaproteobacteria bacterium]